MLRNINNQQIQIHDRVDCNSNTSSKTLSHTLLRLKKQSQFTAKPYLSLPFVTIHRQLSFVAPQTFPSAGENQTLPPMTPIPFTLSNVQSDLHAGFESWKLKRLPSSTPRPPTHHPPTGLGQSICHCHRSQTISTPSPPLFEQIVINRVAYFIGI